MANIVPLNPRPKRRILRTVFWWAITAFAIMTVYGFIRPEKGFGTDPVDHGTTFATMGLVGLAAVCLFAFLFCYLRFFDRNMKVAVQPIPSLAEIDQALRAEGYDPSVQDCIAVEQHLKSERNEAALVAGGLIVGAYLAGRHEI